MGTSSFAHLFHALVVGASAVPLGSCGEESSTNCSGPVSRPEERHTGSVSVDVYILQNVLRDGAITRDECVALCGAEFDLPSCSVSFDGNRYAELTGGGAGHGGASGEGGVAGDPAADVPGWPTSASIELHCQTVSGGGLRHCRGRRHVSWEARGLAVARDPVARWIAESAADEAASVRSFRALRSECGRLGVLREFRSRLNRAAQDEVRHARIMERLAWARGAARPKQKFARIRPRPLVDIARENAREGCVAETFAALLTVHQAHNAPDPELRAALLPVAADECEHAELAWALHRALLYELTPADRETVHRELLEGIAALACDEGGGSPGLPEQARATLGLPEPERETLYRLHAADLLLLRARAVAC